MDLVRTFRSILQPWPRASARARSLYHFLLFSRRRRTVECAGVQATFATPTPTLDEYVQSFTGEKEILTEFLRDLHDDVVWDIGAGFGLYAIFAARSQGTRGTVIAFEPGEYIGALLRTNIHINGATRIRHCAVALGEADGSAPMFEPDSPNAGTGSLADRTDYRVRRREREVEVRSADLLVASGTLPPPTIVKIDTEGAEGKILEGMKAILRSGPVRSVYCEIHPRLLTSFGDSPESVEHALTAAGFVIASRHARGREYHVIAKKQL